MSLCQQRKTKGRSRVFDRQLGLERDCQEPTNLRKEATWTQSRLSQMGTQMQNQKIWTQVWFLCDLYQAVFFVVFFSSLYWKTRKAGLPVSESYWKVSRWCICSPLMCWASVSTLCPKSLSKPQTPDLVFGVKSLPHPSSVSQMPRAPKHLLNEKTQPKCIWQMILFIFVSILHGTCPSATIFTIVSCEEYLKAPFWLTSSIYMQICAKPVNNF